MEAIELRIGNYVFDQDLKIKKVFAISNVRGTAYVQFENEMHLPLTLKISTIPLTEQWLLDFGFEETEFCFRIEKFFLTKSVGKERYLFQAHQNRFVVRYVHQLQNLYYALYEEELIKK